MVNKDTFTTRTMIQIRQLAAGLKEQTAVEALDRTTGDLRHLAEMSGDPRLIEVVRDAELAGALILAELVLNPRTLQKYGYLDAAAEVETLTTRYGWRTVCTELAVLLAAEGDDSLAALEALAAEHEPRDDDPGVRPLSRLGGALELWRRGYRPKLDTIRGE